jgi:hypothetical protein
MDKENMVQYTMQCHSTTKKNEILSFGDSRGGTGAYYVK